MQHPKSFVSFENTQLAFQYKTNKELRQARMLFSMMGQPFLVRIGTRVTPWAIKRGLPIKGLIRKTIFKQFVGGETLPQTAPVVAKLSPYGVKVILDYGVEGGDDGEAAYDHAADEFIRVIDYAATQPNIPFMSVKVTGFSRFTLLAELDERMHQLSGTLINRYLQAIDELDDRQKQEWERVRLRLLRICETARDKRVGVLIDAEETWIQDPVDALTLLMMDEFNKNHPVIYNTIQLYRHDRYAFLKDCYEAAVARHFVLAVKLVRGAYMEKERARAQEKNYPSPIQPSKASTDADYDAAVQFSLERLEQIALIVATHNETSNLKVVHFLQNGGLPLGHSHVHFSQLFGMSDNITFNLAAAGCSVSKYLPFGPIDDVIPYLMRRAQENTSVKGQTGRELGLIHKELKRRSQGE